MTVNQGANTFLPPSPVIPLSLLITNITQSNPAVITVSTPNTYQVGQLVHLSIPASYGMYEADQRTGQILSISGNNFTVSIDTTNFNPFSIPPPGTTQPASLASAGSRNLYNYIEVPFHSAGNFGN